MNSFSLEGKKVLMFSPYGATKHYGDAIKEELERRGALVRGYDERPSQNSFVKIVIRLLKKRIPQLFDRYISKVIDENKNEMFDYILICRGEAFTPLTIQHLKNSFPSAKLILYFWDILRCADVRFNIPFADRAMSFDSQDVEENEGLDYRPTFFINQYLNVPPIEDAKYDVSFIGSMRPNRYRIIRMIEDFFNRNNITFFKYLYVPSFLVYLKDLITCFPYISLKEVRFTPLQIGGSIDVMGNSKAVFDINNPFQKSLSTRAFEAMAAKRKYITTNPEVKKYEFYNPNNIAVLDINSPHIEKEFFNKPFEEVSEEVLYKYSVRGLVDELFKQF